MIEETLALHGGTSVNNREWPQWPQWDDATLQAATEALRGGRWAVSGHWTGSPPLDTLLAEEFADFTGARWCVPVDHGTNALITALHGLGIGPGDEVIVPGLTWVATASVVARVGAVPVLVDIDPATLCMDPQAAEAAITPDTVAIIAVHLYSAMANMSALGKIARRHGLALIEDASQAYGATWKGQGAGSLGVAGAFSAQQGKGLTAGEGGLFVTSDSQLREYAEVLRGDGRRYTSAAPVRGRPDLVESTTVQGWNMHLSEVQAALLLDGLRRLPEQTRKRADAGRILDAELTAAGDLEPITPYPGNDLRSYYHYAIRLRHDAFAGRTAAVVCEALSAELGCWIHTPYPPLNEHPLYGPRRLRSVETDLSKRLDPSRFHLPVARYESGRTILLHHSMLLGDRAHLDAIVSAFDKVRRLAEALPTVSS